MKPSQSFMILSLVFSFLVFNTFPPRECNYSQTISVEDVDISGILQISKENFPASPSSILGAFKSRPQVPSWQVSPFSKLLQDINLSTGNSPLEVIPPRSAISKAVLTTILRC